MSISVDETSMMVIEGGGGGDVIDDRNDNGGDDNRTCSGDDETTMMDQSAILELSMSRLNIDFNTTTRNDDSDTGTCTDIPTSDTCPITIQDTSYYATSPALAAKVPLSILSHTKNTTHNSEEPSMTNNIVHVSDKKRYEYNHQRQLHHQQEQQQCGTHSTKSNSIQSDDSHRLSGAYIQESGSYMDPLSAVDGDHEDKNKSKSNEHKHCETTRNESNNNTNEQNSKNCFESLYVNSYEKVILRILTKHGYTGNEIYTTTSTTSTTTSASEMDKEEEEELINNYHLEQPRKTSCTRTSSTKDFLIDDQINQLYQTLQKNGVYHLLSRIEQQHNQQETATNDQIQEKSFSYPTHTEQHSTTSTSNHEQISEKTEGVLCSSSSTTHDVNQNYTNICTINDTNEVLKQQQHQKNESKMHRVVVLLIRAIMQKKNHLRNT